jgi:hypothetical protein
LAAGLAFLLLSLVVDTRRRGVHRRATASARLVPTSSGAGLAVVALALGLALAPRTTLRAAGDPGLPPAMTEPASPPPRATPATPGAPAPPGSLSGGAAAYRAGQFPQAARAFRDSITRVPGASARRLAEQQDAYYDLGNTLYRAGQSTEQSSRETTLERWTEAVKAYDTALQLRPDDADSRYNRDFVQRKIDALRRDEPPPPSGSNPPAPPHSGTAPPGPPPAGGTPPGAPPPAAPDSMSAEDARELLDSAKGEERPGLGAAPPPAASTPAKPFKNW